MNITDAIKALPLTDTMLLRAVRVVRGSTARLTREVGPYEVTEPTPEFRSLAVAIINEVAALAQQAPAVAGSYVTHLDQIDAEKEARGWLGAMVPTDQRRAFWQWETFSFSPHDGRVHLLRAHDRPVAAALIVRDGLNRSQLLRWTAAQQAPAAEPVDDFGLSIVYDTNAIDDVTRALTGDEGDDDSVTVLQRMATYVQRVWPGKTALQVLMEYEEVNTILNTILKVAGVKGVA